MRVRILPGGPIMKRQRSDDNQSALVALYRGMGCEVEVVSQWCSFDLIIGCQEVNELVEVKDGRKAPSKRNLTAAEQAFQDKWMGRPVVLVECEEDVIRHVNRMREESGIIRKARRWALDNIS